MSKPMSIAFLCLSLIYMFSLAYTPDFIGLLKIIPIAILGVGVLKAKSSSIRSILLLALVFSGCGDLFLALDLFIYGVAAFLLAQLSYAMIFKSYWQGFYHRWPWSLVLIVYMLAMVWLLIPSLGTLQVPVMAYLIVIGAMGLLAVQSSLPIRWTVLGAMAFITSDSLIAINKFIVPIPLESYWIMSTYYAAQFMLVTGFLTSVRQQKDA